VEKKPEVKKDDTKKPDIKKDEGKKDEVKKDEKKGVKKDDKKDDKKDAKKDAKKDTKDVKKDIKKEEHKKDEVIKAEVKADDVKQEEAAKIVAEVETEIAEVKAEITEQKEETGPEEVKEEEKPATEDKEVQEVIQEKEEKEEKIEVNESPSKENTTTEAQAEVDQESTKPSQEEVKSEETDNHLANGETNGTQAHSNGHVDNDKIFSALKDITGGDVRSKVNDETQIGKYIMGKILKYEKKIATLTYENEQFKKGLSDDQLAKKTYQIKAPTKEIIVINEPEWVTDLFDKTTPTPDILLILELFLTLLEDNEIPSSESQEEFWNYSSEYFKSRLSNTIDLLLSVEQKTDISIEKTLKIKKLIKGRSTVLNPNTFDNINPFCMVISILLKEICEYLGILNTDPSKKGSNNNDKIYQFNHERIDLNNQRQNKLLELTKKFNLSTE